MHKKYIKNWIKLIKNYNGQIDIIEITGKFFSMKDFVKNPLIEK